MRQEQLALINLSQVGIAGKNTSQATTWIFRIFTMGSGNATDCVLTFPKLF